MKKEIEEKIIKILEAHNHQISGASLNWAEKIKEDFEKIVLPKEKRYTEETANKILALFPEYAKEEYKKGYNQRLKDEGKTGEDFQHLYL